MKWMLVIVVFGTYAVKTDLIFDRLDECLKAEAEARAEYARAYSEWLDWARQNPKEASYPKSQQFMTKRIGLENSGTCIPHAAQRKNF